MPKYVTLAWEEYVAGKHKARVSGLFFLNFCLLDFRFFIHYVLSYHGIVLHSLHLFGMKAFVFGSRIVVAGAGA